MFAPPVPATVHSHCTVTCCRSPACRKNGYQVLATSLSAESSAVCSTVLFCGSSA